MLTDRRSVSLFCRAAQREPCGGAVRFLGSSPTFSHVHPLASFKTHLLHLCEAIIDFIFSLAHLPLAIRFTSLP